jgi:hypothetical protein
MMVMMMAYPNALHRAPLKRICDINPKRTGVFDSGRRDLKRLTRNRHYANACWPVNMKRAGRCKVKKAEQSRPALPCFPLPENLELIPEAVLGKRRKNPDRFLFYRVGKFQPPGMQTDGFFKTSPRISVFIIPYDGAAQGG